MTPSDPLPTDLAAAHAMILSQREMLTMVRSEVTVGRLEIERLKLMLAKARREQFGQSSERGKQLIEQLELAIEDLEETQAEVEAKAEMAAPEAAKEKRARAPRPPRKPLPDNLPVERIVEPPPCACGKCGGVRLRKLGEVVSKFRIRSFQSKASTNSITPARPPLRSISLTLGIIATCPTAARRRMRGKIIRLVFGHITLL